MPFEPNAKQTLVLFSLLFGGHEPKVSELRPRLDPKERAPLLEAGLIEIERRGRSSHVVLTDAAWAWAGAHLDAPISKTARANDALHAVLTHLKAFLDARGIALSDVVRASRAAAPPEARPEPAPARAPSSEALAKHVRDACLRAAGGRTHTRVRIAQVRSELPHVPRPALDQTLYDMQRAGAMVLYPLDDPQEIQPADEREALVIAGTPHHVLYLNG